MHFDDRPDFRAVDCLFLEQAFGQSIEGRFAGLQNLAHFGDAILDDLAHFDIDLARTVSSL